MASFQAIPVPLPHDPREWLMLELMQVEGFPTAYKTARLFEEHRFPPISEMPDALYELGCAMEVVRKWTECTA